MTPYKKTNMKSIKKTITAIAFSCLSILTAQETETTTHSGNEGHNHSRPDSHAPIGVMGDHTHNKGGFMFSYRAMYMGMEGMLNGSDDISAANVLAEGGFPVTPTEMTMQMHMLGVMYAPSDRVTLMAMTSYKANDMDLVIIASDTPFNTNATGLGDTKIGALVSLVDKNNHKVHANASLSIPTGSVDNRDDIPVLNNALLAYPMQTGSGTWDPSMGVTYTSHKGLFGWGAQTMFTFPVGNNDKEYSLGEKTEATAWGSIQAADFISFSTRLKFTKTGNIQGAADDLTTPFVAGNGNTIILANFMPVFNTENSGRTQLDLNFGSNLVIKSVKGLRVGLEVGLPVYQDVNGIQMKNTIAGTIGILYAL